MSEFVTKIVEKKGMIATIASIVAMIGVVSSVYMSLTNNLEAAKTARTTQVNAILLDVTTLQTEMKHVHEEVDSLREWNKKIGDRLNTQEKASAARASESLEDRINRLEDSAMGAQHKNGRK